MDRGLERHQCLVDSFYTILGIVGGRCGDLALSCVVLEGYDFECRVPMNSKELA